MNSARQGRTKPAKGGVRVGRSQTGKGVFASRRYRQDELIGEIVGRLIDDAEYGSEYCFELGAGLQLEPAAPFRFINHSCEPNCEFDCIDLPSEDGSPPETRLFLFAARFINANDQLTIDYNWTAESAIPCRCGAAHCRGWIVDPSDLCKVVENFHDGSLPRDKELSSDCRQEAAESQLRSGLSTRPIGRGT